MRALVAATLACALIRWGHLAEVRATVALLLVVIAVCTLEASPRTVRPAQSEVSR